MAHCRVMIPTISNAGRSASCIMVLSNPMASLEPENRLVILIPVFNDWEALELLLADLDRTLAQCPMLPQVLIVDDGSTAPIPSTLEDQPYRTLRSVEILRLRRNLGHQRAIAVGFVFVQQSIPCEAVVLMDGDGEDLPQSVLLLVDRFCHQKQDRIVFAARAKRLERWWFRLFYHAYRLAHRLVTGAPVRVGNFSLVPRGTLEQLVVVPEIWNHYAAAAIRAALPYENIPINRGRRLVGQSKMNPIGLLLHGLSAIFVYADIVGARLFVGAVFLTVLAAATAAIAIVASLTARPALSGWPVYVAGILCIILLQAVMLSLVLVFSVIGGRVNSSFLPVRDCPYFVSGVRKIFPGGTGPS